MLKVGVRDDEHQQMPSRNWAEKLIGGQELWPFLVGSCQVQRGLDEETPHRVHHPQLPLQNLERQWASDPD
jgi:hypothetical protein